MEDFKKDAEDNKVMGILAYLGILVLVPIFAAKESLFARFHSNQGLILLIVAIVLGVAINIINAILIKVSYTLVFLTALLSIVIWLGILVFMIIGIINAAKGEMKELPIIGKYKILK